jgi:hypothetical protein
MDPHLGRPGHGPHGPGLGGAPFHEHLFPPELVLSNQSALALTADQLTAIKEAIKETHSRTIDLQVELHRVTERLEGILEPAKVDPGSALAAAEEAMSLEAQIKKTHLGMLIRVKNVLTEDQLAKLRTMRPPRPEPPR